MLLYTIYFELYGPFFTKRISISNFAYIATSKPRISAENIDIIVSGLPSRSPFFNATVLPILKQTYQISSYSSHNLRSIVHPILTLILFPLFVKKPYTTLVRKQKAL